MVKFIMVLMLTWHGHTAYYEAEERFPTREACWDASAAYADDLYNQAREAGAPEDIVVRIEACTPDGNPA